MRRWSELSPVELELELSNVRIKPDVLTLDVRDVPELRERCEVLKDPARLLLALRWFGDEGHPQPPREIRTSWHSRGYTPDWGRLPPLEDEPPAEKDDHGGGRPRKEHPGVALREATRMIRNDETNKSAIARAATQKARDRIEPDVLASRKWETGFSARDDVDLLLAAVKDGLVAWTPGGLLVRKTRYEVFEPVDDFAWLAIPQAK